MLTPFFSFGPFSTLVKTTTKNHSSDACWLAGARFSILLLNTVFL
jgi:hypothetical protein